MTGTSATIIGALRPVLTGTALEQALAPDERPGRSAYLLLCTATRKFRQHHPGVLAPLDLEHPDGCMDLIVEVDDEGRLVQASLEMLDLDADLVGRPIEDVLPVLADRLRDLLSAS